MTTYADILKKNGSMSDLAIVETAIRCAAGEAYVPVGIVFEDGAEEIVAAVARALEGEPAQRDPFTFALEAARDWIGENF